MSEQSKMTNEEAFEKFILSDDWQEIRLHAQNSDELAENVWQAAISYMQEQSEPVAWLRKNGFRFNADIEPQDDREIPLFTTPQRQQPLKRLDEDKINEIFTYFSDTKGNLTIDNWHLLASVFMDAMQEINKCELR